MFALTGIKFISQYSINIYCQTVSLKNTMDNLAYINPFPNDKF